MRWWMRFPWTRWIQRLFGRWHGSAARPSQPMFLVSPSSRLPKDTPPAPLVTLPSDGPPWDWGWLLGNESPGCNEIASPPAPSETNSPGTDAGEAEKNNQATPNTEAIDAVFTDYAPSNETSSSRGDPSNSAIPN